MRLYFCSDNRSISFEESSQDYRDIKELLYSDILIVEDLFLDNNQKPILINYLESKIELLLKERISNATSLNTVNKEHKNQNLLLGRNEIDVRLIFLIDLRDFLLQSKEIYVYHFPKIEDEIKDLHSKLKKDLSLLRDLNKKEIDKLIKYGLVYNQENNLLISDKARRIPFIM